jgi:hypothetical protein
MGISEPTALRQKMALADSVALRRWINWIFNATAKNSWLALRQQLFVCLLADLVIRA